MIETDSTRERPWQKSPPCGGLPRGLFCVSATAGRAHDPFGVMASDRHLDAADGREDGAAKL